MKFFKIFLLVLVVGTIVTSCKKDPVFDPKQQLAVDEAIIKTFLADNGITAQRHESGVYYVLTSPGTGSFPYSDLNSTSVTVKYSGKLLNGFEFDSNTTGVTFGPPQFPNGLYNLIDAWRIALAPKEIGGIVEGGLQNGGKIRVISPSLYGYGRNPSGSIPANSILDFEIELVEVKD